LLADIVVVKQLLLAKDKVRNSQLKSGRKVLVKGKVRIPLCRCLSGAYTRIKRVLN
jgi:hypothetical protein